jgi:hypothetical protein
VVAGFTPETFFGSGAILEADKPFRPVNNSHLIFLVRSNSVLGLGAHLAAGILALILLAGAARGENRTVSHVATASSVTVGR